jgi:ankyrin repeat protein
MDGGIEDVILYLEAGMSANDEKIHRTSSISLKPLMLAAAGGHSNVISALIKYKADIHAIDKRGRNALHHAAINGHVDAALTLLDAGVGIFDGDFQGNNPLHLAAENNHVKMVDFLAYKGQNFTREITSDKLRVKVNTKFDDLAAIVFEAMQDKKLSRRDYRRFEKTWCHEGYSLTHLLTHSPNHLLTHLKPQRCFAR